MSSIVETLKLFITILLGPRLMIYTDNKTLTFRIFNNDIVLRWRIILEEYGPYIEYIKGDKYIIAEELSRLPINRNQETTQESTNKKEVVSKIIENKGFP